MIIAIIIANLIAVAALLMQYFDSELIADQNDIIEQQAAHIDKLKSQRDMWHGYADDLFWQCQQMQRQPRLRPIRNTIDEIDAIDWN